MASEPRTAGRVGPLPEDAPLSPYAAALAEFICHAAPVGSHVNPGNYRSYCGRHAATVVEVQHEATADATARAERAERALVALAEAEDGWDSAWEMPICGFCERGRPKDDPRAEYVHEPDCSIVVHADAIAVARVAVEAK